MSARVAHVAPANEHNRAYLRTKALRCGHLLAGGREGAELGEVDLRAGGARALRGARDEPAVERAAAARRREREELPGRRP